MLVVVGLGGGAENYIYLSVILGADECSRSCPVVRVVVRKVAIQRPSGTTVALSSRPAGERGNEGGGRGLMAGAVSVTAMVASAGGGPRWVGGHSGGDG